MPPGKLSLVGVGPGDPELLTRKAERAIREADLLYHPGRDHETGFAVQIVRDLIAPKTLVRSAAVELAESADRYESLASELATNTQAGKRVVFITEGDPLFYSTAARLLTVLSRDWPALPIEIVPGVTSLTAVAAAAHQTLVQGDETLIVIPACHHADRLDELLASHDRVALLKVGSVLGTIIDVLERRGWLDRAVYVELAGTTREQIIRDLRSVDPTRVSYFSMILVTRPGT